MSELIKNPGYESHEGTEVPESWKRQAVDVREDRAVKGVWHIKGAPAWFAADMLAGRIKGLIAQGWDGTLTVSLAVPPDAQVVEWERLLPPPGRDPASEPVRTETARFRPNHARSELFFVGSVVNDGGRAGP